MAKRSSTEPKTLQDFHKMFKPATVRFVHLYLGGEGGACWNNATKAYGVAYDKDMDDAKEAKTARSEASKLMTNPDIQAYKHFLLVKHGYTEDAIKERFSQLGRQDSNLGVALSATEKIAKIAGVIKEDALKVNIPELTALGEGIKEILTAAKKK